MTTPPPLPRKRTACILCECNCGLEVQTSARSLVKIRGDKHPVSAGYTCAKPLRLDRYQNGRHRLDSPLRRRPDGTSGRIGWDTAISEVADRLEAIRDVRVSPEDARRLGLDDGDPVRITTKAGSAQAVVEITDMMQPGHVSLPNGLGLDHPGHGSIGVAPNDLTSLHHRDALVGTPMHEHVPARLEAVRP